MNTNLILLFFIAIFSIFAYQQYQIIKEEEIEEQREEDIEELHELFLEWKELQGKNYSDEDEEKYRKIIFSNHYKMIERLDLEIEEEVFDFFNEIMDLTEEEFHVVFNGITTHNGEKYSTPEVGNHLLQSAVEKQSNRLSGDDSADYTHLIKEIRHQGTCGLCWAFATNAALEATLSDDILSPQNLGDCVTDGRKQTGCPYGISRSGFPHLDYLKKNGIAYEKDQPYVYSSTHTSQCNTSSENYQLPSDISIASFEDFSKPRCDLLKTLVKQYGPTYTSVYSATPEFMYYKDGVASHGPNAEWIKEESWCFFGYCFYRDFNVDHAVLVVGYTEDYWIVQNSWGKSWGHDGLIKIKMGDHFNICHKGVAFVSDEQSFF